MKKYLTVFLLLSLIVFFSSCTAPNAVEAPADSDEVLTGPSSEELQARIFYYEESIKHLQNELIDAKAALYTMRVEYEAKIEAMQPSAPVDGNETSPEFCYRIEGGKVTVTSYIGDEKNVIIPATLGGCPVVKIADRAFENNTKITNITVPEGICEVGWFAFSGCVALESVTLPNSLTSICYGAFLNCNQALTILCLEDSYAMQYARSYGYRTKKL